MVVLCALRRRMIILCRRSCYQRGGKMVRCGVQLCKRTRKPEYSEAGTPSESSSSSPGVRIIAELTEGWRGSTFASLHKQRAGIRADSSASSRSRRARAARARGREDARMGVARALWVSRRLPRARARNVKERPRRTRRGLACHRG